MQFNVESLIKDIVKDLTLTFFEKGIDAGAEQYGKALVMLELCFKKYLKRSYTRYSKIKSLLYRDTPVELKKYYVPTDFKLGDAIINGSDVFSSFRFNKKILLLEQQGLVNQFC